MNNLKILLIIFSLLCPGCETLGFYPSRAQRQSFITSHPQIRSDIKAAILEGKVGLTMTKDEVTASWGIPAHKDVSTSSWGSVETWTYGSCINGCTILTFDQNGKLINSYQSQ